MRLPVIHGVIRRRILVNFRVEPEVIRPLVPDHFQITLVDGFAMAGICLIRLENVRPLYSARAGLASDNVAYRVAVRWNGSKEGGVFIPRRDTSSALQHRLGRRLFPGEYQYGQFETSDADGMIRISCRSSDGRGDVDLIARETERFPADSVFRSLDEASSFFEEGSIGYSPTSVGTRLDGLQLRPASWRVSPLAIDHIESAFFDDPRRFPPGSVALDEALIMRDIAHEWHALPELDLTA